MSQADPRSRKRRARNISDLTEEQIHQKRQIDRKAQSAFRQRTRDRIANLERQIVDLQESSTERESQLQHELQTLRAHNEILVRRVSSIADLATIPMSPLSHEGTYSKIPQSEVWHSLPTNPDHRSQSVQSPNNADIGAARPAIAQVASEASVGTGNGVAGSPQSYPFPDTTLSDAGFSSVDYEINRRSHAVSQPEPPSRLLISDDLLSMEKSSYAGARTVCMVLPVHVAPTCPLDQILTGFFNSQRDLLSQGMLLETVIGPQRASVKALIQPGLATSEEPISKVMAEVMSTYLEVQKAEQLALFYLMHQDMRWQISPTRENYLFMPAWLRPTVTQITVPHAAWIDNVPWPGVRDLLIEHPEDYPYELWTENFTQNVSVNWKFEISDALSETEGDIYLHSIFEKHIHKLKNWTVSTEFTQLFPKLVPEIFARD